MSCAQVEYRSRGKIPLRFDVVQGDDLKIKIDRKIDYYLWGTYPKKHVFYLDEIVQSDGNTSLSRLEIFEHMTWSDYLLTVLFLGVYHPRTLTINGYVYKAIRSND